MGTKEVYTSKPWLKAYNEWIPADINIEKKSLAEAFDEAAEKWKGRTAILFYGSKISYRELKEQVDRFANALHELGIRKGDTVAILMLNSPQFIISFYAAMKLGAVVTPISPVYVSPEIKYQVENSEAKDIICMDILWDKVERAGVEFRNVILTNISEFLPISKRILGKSLLKAIYRKMEIPTIEIYEREGFYRFTDLIKKCPPLPPDISIDPKEDLAVLLYTGGTTGWPKGAMITHYGLYADTMQSKAFFGPIFEDGKSVFIAYGPMYHVAMLQVAVVGGIIRGYTLVVFANPDLDAILDATEIQKATAFFGVPSLWDGLKDYDKTMRVNWKRLNILVSGGDALLEDTATGWEKRTGVPLHDLYGLSECSSVTHMTPYNKPKVGSFGVPLPSTIAAILHPENNTFLPVGEIGEVAIKGPQVCKGYWKRPEETAEQWVEIDGEIWFRTGDLAHMDKDGYFFFYDRKKDIIKYKGLQVYARMVEEVIKGHPKIREVGVVGVPDASVGEQVKAYVVPEVESRGKITESEIVEWCEDKLAHYMIPKIIEFRGEIPKTDIGKVSRRELREELHNE